MVHCLLPLCALTSSRLDPLKVTHYSLISVFISLPAKIIHHGHVQSTLFTLGERTSISKRLE